MRREELKLCQPVWAPLGSVGWRPAFVLGFMSRGRVRLQFETASQSEGIRHECTLRPRNPKLLGDDKPPMDESEAVSEEGRTAIAKATP